jgi:hypothetical protein
MSDGRRVAIGHRDPWAEPRGIGRPDLKVLLSSSQSFAGGLLLYCVAWMQMQVARRCQIRDFGDRLLELVGGGNRYGGAAMRSLAKVVQRQTGSR